MQRQNGFTTYRFVIVVAFVAIVGAILLRPFLLGMANRQENGSARNTTASVSSESSQSASAYAVIAAESPKSVSLPAGFTFMYVIPPSDTKWVRPDGLGDVYAPVYVMYSDDVEQGTESAIQVRTIHFFQADRRGPGYWKDLLQLKER